MALMGGDIFAEPRDFSGHLLAPLQMVVYTKYVSDAGEEGSRKPSESSSCGAGLLF
jgi:hypothetical protein